MHTQTFPNSLYADETHEKNIEINLLFPKIPTATLPRRANTDRAKTVKIITSRRFFTDSITAPTMVFNPVKD